MKKIFCLIALMIATVSLASAQVIGAYSLTKSSGAYAEMAGGTALDLSTVKYVAEPEANATVAFAYGADGLVQGTALTDIKGISLGFDFEFNNTQMKYFAINGSGLVYLSDTESFQVWPAQPSNALTAGANYSTVPCVGLCGTQNKVRVTDDTAITYSVSGAEGKKVFTAQFKNLSQVADYSNNLDVTNFQVKLYQETGVVELVYGSWSGEKNLSTRMGLAGLNGDMLNVKGSLDAPTTGTTSGNVSIAPASVVAGTTLSFTPPAPCVAPTAQPTNITGEVTSISANGQFTPVESGADHYLIVLLQGDATFTPADGEMYAAKATPEDGVVVLDYTTGNTYRTQVLGDLVPSTDYTVRVYAANSMCKNGPSYNNLVEPLEYKFTTGLDMPASLVLTPASPTSVKINVAADAKGDQVLVAVNQNPALNPSTHFPEDYGEFGTPTGTYKVGDEIEGGGRVVYVGAAKDGIVVDGLTPNQPVYVNAWSTDGAGNYGTIMQEGRTSTELQLPYVADYSKMGTYMEPCGYVVNDEYLNGQGVVVMTDASGHLADNGFKWNSSGAGGAGDIVEGTVTLPAFQVPAAGARMTFEHQLFKAGMYGGANTVVNWDDHILEVEIAEVGSTDYKQVFKIGDGVAPEPNDVNLHTYSIGSEKFAQFAGKKVNLRFKWSRYTDANSVIKNIFIEEVPEIDYASEVTVAAVDGGDVTIDWTDRYAEAAKWEVRYQRVGTTSWSEPVATTEKPYTIKDLALSSQYTIQVRVVAGDKVSPWAEVSARTALGSPYSVTYEALPFTDGWEAKQFAVDGTAITLTDDAVTNWRYNANYGLMYSGNYDRALVTPAIKLGETEKPYTITITPGRPVTAALKNASYIAVSKDNGETWKVADAVSFNGLTSTIQMNLSGNVKIALCIAKGNTSFYIKGFGIEATYDPELAGKSVESYSEKAATVQPRTWYVLTQTRNGESPAYDSELGGKIMRASKNFSIPKGSNVEEYTQYLIRLLPTEFEGVYHLQWGNGNFWGANLNSVDNIENAGMFKIYNINGEDTHFGINGTPDGTTLGQPLDNNGEGKDVAFWGSGEVTSLDGNNDWKFYPVELGIYDAEQLVRNAEMAELVAQLEKTMDKNNRAQVGDNLITEESQLSSDYSDPDEGKSLGALIDENPATYWHTNWHSVPAEGTHPTLKIELAEPISGDIQLTFQRRDSKRDHSTGMQILTSTDGENYTEAATVELPFTATGEVVRGIFNLAEPAKYLAVYSNGAVQGNGTTPEEASRNYWHVAELQLNKYISATPLNEKYPDAAAALQQAINAAKAIDKPSAEDIAALQAAYEAYVEAINYVPVADTETKYFTAEQLRAEVENMGQALIGVLNVTTTANKYVTETLRSSEASADGTLAGVRAPQEEEVFEVLAVEGGYVLRHHNAAEGEGYLGLNGNTFAAADQAGATVWTILGPDEEGYGTVSGFDDMYPDIAAELNPNMVRFITQGQYLNGQNFENIGGIRGGTGAWSFNYVRNANYVEPANYRPALAEAITAGEEALEKHLLDEPVVTVKGEGLIKSADQFASEYADSEEGTDFGALIDEEPTTYWHTDWHGTAPEGAHSFDVNLPENTITSFAVTYTGRYNQNNCSPIVMTIYGKNEGGEWETITTLTQEDGLGANAGQGRSSDVDALSGTFNFQTEKAYTDFRFEAHAVWADAGLWTDIEDFEYPEGAKVNDEACFNYSEFQMYEAVIYKYDIDPAIAAALEAAVAEGKALYNDETIASDDAQLQAATDAINEAVEAVENAEIIIDNTHTYTIKFVNAPEDGAYLQIDGNWYSEGETVESETELTAEDITVSCDPAYTYEISIKNGVITVTFQKPDGINGLTTDGKNATIYNLQGQRINAAGRGLNVVNGKVVLKK